MNPDRLTDVENLLFDLSLYLLVIKKIKKNFFFKRDKRKKNRVVVSVEIS